VKPLLDLLAQFEAQQAGQGSGYGEIGPPQG